MLLHGVERLGEAPLDRLGQLGAQLLELGEARLEVLALRRELVEPLLLGVVLLLRERVDLAERLAAALEALRALGELVAVVAFGALLGARVLEPAPRLVGLRLDARDLDVDRRHARRRVRQRLPQLDLGRAEPAQLLAELAGARAARVDVRAQRRLEARGRVGGAGERRVEPLRAREHAGELVRTRAPPAGPDGGVDPRGLGGAGALAELGRLGRGRVVRGDERARLVRRSPSSPAPPSTLPPSRERSRSAAEARLDRGCELAAQRALGLAELAQRRAERGGALGAGLAAGAQRRLDDVDRAVERLERALEPRRRGEQRLAASATSARRRRSRGAAAVNAASAFAACSSARGGARSASRACSASAFASSASARAAASSSSSTASAVSPANQSSPRCGS